MSAAHQPLRTLFATAALAATTVVAGCATTISGSGRLAADAPTLPSSSTPAFPNPGSTGFPGQLPTGLPSSGGENIPDDSEEIPEGSICSAVSKDELQAIFKEPVTVEPTGIDVDCDFNTAKGSVSIAIDDEHNLQYVIDSHRQGKNLTIAGFPAFNVADHEFDIGLSKDPSVPGVIIAFNTYRDPDIDPAKALALFAKVVPKFAN